MREVQQPEILSVSQLTRQVKNLLEMQISYIWVSGEISNWRVSPAGHAYFTLKDKDAQVDAEESGETQHQLVYDKKG